MGNTQYCRKSQTETDIGGRTLKPQHSNTYRSFKPFSAMPKRDRTVSNALSEISVVSEPVTDFYNFGKIIGDGKFGVVRKATHVTMPDCTVAIKTINLENVTEVESLIQEISALRQVDHPNIVRVLETYRDAKYLHIVMEQC